MLAISAIYFLSSKYVDWREQLNEIHKCAQPAQQQYRVEARENEVDHGLLVEGRKAIDRT